MKPYGLRKGDELEYSNMGAPSRHRKISSNSRKTSRRFMHQNARRNAKKDITNAIKEMDE